MLVTIFRTNKEHPPVVKCRSLFLSHSKEQVSPDSMNPKNDRPLMPQTWELCRGDLGKEMFCQDPALDLPKSSFQDEVGGEHLFRNFEGREVLLHNCITSCSLILAPSLEITAQLI